MGRVLRALASLSCTAVLMTVAASPCAGWETTPQERHDCCQRQHCRHLTERSGTSQSDADQCCARAERGTPDRTDEMRVVPVQQIASIVEAFPLAPSFDETTMFALHLRPPDRALALLLKSVLQI